MKPEIELPDLSQLSGSRPKVEVTAEELLTELESLRERSVNWVEEAEDVVAENGHQVTIDFKGTIDDVRIYNVTLNDHQVSELAK